MIPEQYYRSPIVQAMLARATNPNIGPVYSIGHGLALAGTQILNAVMAKQFAKDEQKRDEENTNAMIDVLAGLGNGSWNADEAKEKMKSLESKDNSSSENYLPATTAAPVQPLKTGDVNDYLSNPPSVQVGSDGSVAPRVAPTTQPIGQGNTRETMVKAYENLISARSQTPTFNPSTPRRLADVARAAVPVTPPLAIPPASLAGGDVLPEGAPSVGVGADGNIVSLTAPAPVVPPVRQPSAQPRYSRQYNSFIRGEDGELYPVNPNKEMTAGKTSDGRAISENTIVVPFDDEGTYALIPTYHGGQTLKPKQALERAINEGWVIATGRDPYALDSYARNRHKVFDSFRGMSPEEMKSYFLSNLVSNSSRSENVANAAIIGGKLSAQPTSPLVPATMTPQPTTPTNLFDAVASNNPAMQRYAQFAEMIRRMPQSQIKTALTQNLLSSAFGKMLADPKTQYRSLSNEEKKSLGIPENVGVQMGEDGELKVFYNPNRGGGINIYGDQPPPSSFEDSLTKKIGDDMASWVAGGNVISHNNIKSLFKALMILQNTPGLTGPGSGLVPDQFETDVQPTISQVKQMIYSTVQQTLREINGAQFTDAEAKRVLNLVFDKNAPNSENIRRVQKLIDIMQDQAKNKDALLEYLQANNGRILGYKNPYPAAMTADNYITMLKEESEDNNNSDNSNVKTYNPATGEFER